MVAVLLLAFVAIGVALLVLSKAATLTATLTLSPSTNSTPIPINTNFDVSVYENSATQTVNAVNVGLSYDQSKVQFVSIDSTGSAFPLCTEKSGGSGIVKLTCVTDYSATPPVQSVTGSKLIAKVTFKALVGTGNSTTMSFVKDYPAPGSEAKSAIYYAGTGENVWDGNTATAGTYTFITPDVTPPTVSITAPTDGATVSGTTNITANAADTGGSGVNKVEFYVNNVLRCTDTTSPYACSFDTVASGLADGTYAVYAKAFDQATPTPNTTNSASINMKIQNNKPDLLVSAVNLSPANPTAGSTVTISAVVQNGGTAAIIAGTSKSTTFTVDGVALGSTVTDTTALAVGATYTVTATTTWTATAGSHSIVANVDTGGQITETNEANNSSTKSVTVYKLGDTDNSGAVTMTDLLAVINNWNLTGRTRAQGDVTGDGTVTISDLLQVINNWTGQ